MSGRRICLLVGAVVILAGLLVWEMNRWGEDRKPSARHAGEVIPRRALAQATAAPAGGATWPGALPQPASEAAGPVVGRLVAAQAPVDLARQRVVVRVNGVPITGSDLAPWTRGEPEERTLSQEMFAFLLKRAIDRELVFQAARAEGVSLSTAEAQMLEQLRTAERDRDPAQVEFDVRDATGELLLAALVAKSGGPGPFAGPADVGSYYLDHRDEFGVLPEGGDARAVAWRRIESEIRGILARERQAAYRDRLRETLARLESASRISDGRREARSQRRNPE